MTFTNSLKTRRSIYALGRKVKNVDEVISEVKEAVKYTASAFNSQTTRVLIVAGEAQDKLWGDIVLTDLIGTMQAQGVPEEAQEATKAKLAGFQAGFGTILFFEDQDVVKGLQANFPLYADNFPFWAEQADGAATQNVWNTLAELGLGANLQHYNPVIDASVAKEFGIPANWQLRGQMVFGSIEASAASEKEFMADEDRFKIVK